MRILDQNGNEILESDVNYDTGYLKNDRILICHRESVDAVAEEGHWETIREYPNGGKDVDWIVDVPGIEAKEAWDEYEDVLRFIPYTNEEIAERAAANKEEEERQARLDLLAGNGIPWDEIAMILHEGVNSI